MKKFTKFVGRSFVIMMLAFLTTMVVAGAIFIRGVDAADIPDSPLSVGQNAPIEIYASDGKTLISKIHPEDGTREVVDSDKISDNMKNAIISAEDATFYDNYGFAPKRIAAAALGHLTGSGDTAGGGSTITQQFVKNTLVGDEYSLARKWNELLSSTKLTASWEKDEIITAYLNTIYFGRGASGIERASQAYFGVHAEELTKSQAALIAGVVQSPSSNDPAVNKESAESRFDYVVDQMHKNGYISDVELPSITFPKTIAPKPQNAPIGLSDENGHIASMALAELGNHGFDRKRLFSIGARVITSIDADAQKTLVNTSRSVGKDNGVKVSTVSIEAATGRILGLYGGDNGLGFNYATNPQMTGSTFKVFTLAAALENGIGTDTMISSAPYQSGNVTIGNSEGMTCGTCSIKEATKQSLNTSFYRLQDMLPNGAEDTRTMARKLGVNADLNEPDGSVNKGITLGVYGTSPTQMAAGFATIANDGKRVDRHIVDSVYTQNNALAYSAEQQPVSVISAASAHAIDDALQPIPAYSNDHQLTNGATGYFKTGTVQKGDVGGGNRDAWVVGYTKDDGDRKGISTAVWIGTDDGDYLTDAYGASVWGATLPADVWQQVMNSIS